MAAEFGQQIPHLHQSLKHVIALDGPSGTLCPAFRPGQHQGRLLVFLPQSSGDDAGQGLVAVRQKHHQHLVLLVILIHQGRGLLRSLYGHVLSLVI